MTTINPAFAEHRTLDKTRASDSRGKEKYYLKVKIHVYSLFRYLYVFSRFNSNLVFRLVVDMTSEAR